jgi:predicted dehydrogenase
MIGAPRFASIVRFSDYVSSYEEDIPEWWFDPERGGCWLGASGSHFVDQIRTWLGEFAAVSASLSTVRAARGPVDDSFAVRFTLRSGLEGVMQQTAGAFGPAADFTRMVGSAGSIWTDGMAIRLGTRDVQVPADMVLPEPPPLTGDPRHARAEWQMMAAFEVALYTQLCCVLRAAITGERSPSRVRPAGFGDGSAQ